MEEFTDIWSNDKKAPINADLTHFISLSDGIKIMLIVFLSLYLINAVSNFKKAFF